MQKNLYLFLFFAIISLTSYAQSKGNLTGSVTDRTTSLGLADVNIVVSPSGSFSAISDSLGRFKIEGIPVGTYTFRISRLGYKSETVYNIVISSGNEQTFNVELDRIDTLNEVKIVAARSATAATLATPLSVQRLTAEEIRSNPGGNFDVSRVIQALPGVTGTDGSSGSFRNDIIIRGGAPNENVFYLDGIEMPVINHFSTQGSSGGPAGILNVSFLQDVKLSSSAFDARYDNALSSVLQFTQKNGNTDRYQGNVRLSASELALTTEGPISPKTTFLASVRRSYLQLLFSLLDIPVRPNYYDFQTKITHKLNPKTTLTFIGLGAIDEFKFGTIKNATPEKLYSLANSPSINQYNYTIGATLKRSLRNGFFNLALSRDVLNNRIEKYDDNDQNDPSKLRLDIGSREIGNRLRADFNFSKDGWQWSYGATAQYIQSNNDYYQRYRAQLNDENGNVTQPAQIFQSQAALNYFKFGAFAQAGKRFLDSRLGVNLGVRTDMNSFTSDGMNAGRTLSPRISFTYALAEQWNLNASAGIYYKLPVNTILGFTDANGNYLNKSAIYTRSTHYVAGVEFLPRASTRFTLEVYNKQYRNYPVSVRDGISLANEGGDYNVVGNEAVATIGSGQAYGIEFFAQQKLTSRFFGVLSASVFRSKFTGLNGKYVPSAFDSRRLVSLTLGYKLPKNYEIGLKFRYAGGVPYTPFDDAASRANYLTTGAGVYNYSQANTLRLGPFNSSDIRIDKRWNFRKTSFDLYIDVTDWYGAIFPAYPDYTFARTTDNTAFLTTDGKPIRQDGSNAVPLLLRNTSAGTLPTIGFIWEF
ncbi:TonB-dependent receptor [Mucilaginibacter achroorhodeus]|uniref:TonB-dependent receptor n=1 Tax=Mucilaginibacter achroorhodeus TaxID=2599294 RepID=A0A563U6N9_9SPHI|nr:TonB-dependent receptor [Mucilaginibacter achroorhodeus]TWR27017.1 TonB-dependent receptor [Mucilaginibacter achroorhodeus]